MAIGVAEIVVSFGVIRFDFDGVLVTRNRVRVVVGVVGSDALIVISEAQRIPHIGVVSIQFICSLQRGNRLRQIVLL